MRVILAHPPNVEGYGHYELPLHLAYLAAELQRGGHDVSVVDIQLHGHSALTAALDRGCDLFGITTYSYCLRNTADILCCVRQHWPNSLIVLGGPHASFAPCESFARFPEADAIAKGEGEQVLRSLCDYMEKRGGDRRPTDEVLGIATRACPAGGRTMSSARRNINAIAPATEAYHLFDIPKSRIRNPYAPILASRGCVYQCVFCLSPRMWGSMRVRSFDNVRTELETLASLGFRFVNFRDDVFSLLRQLTYRLLPYLKEHFSGWSCETRLDDLTHDRIDDLCDAGLTRSRVSIETLHHRSLVAMDKHPKVCDLQERIRHLSQRCEEVRLSFMIGIPGETADDVRATMDFAEGLSPAVCKFWAYSPLPGTPLYDHPKAYGITILPHEELSPTQSVIATAEMSNDTINQLIAEARSRFSDPLWRN